jgi:hypothetical protein
MPCRIPGCPGQRDTVRQPVKDFSFSGFLIPMKLRYHGWWLFSLHMWLAPTLAEGIGAVSNLGVLPRPQPPPPTFSMPSMSTLATNTKFPPCFRKNMGNDNLSASQNPIPSGDTPITSPLPSVTEDSSQKLCASCERCQRMIFLADPEYYLT